MGQNSYGNLTVNVRYASGAVPIKDAFVSVEGKENAATRYKTDVAGKTDIENLTEGEYSLVIKKDGFFDKEYRSVLIIGGIGVIVNAELFPKIETPLKNGE